MNKPFNHLIPFFLLILIACKSYKQDILFRYDENTKLQQAVYDVERNYRMSPNDWLEIRLFTNGGEQAIDPNYESVNGQLNQQQQQQQNRLVYLVQKDGSVKLPMIGTVMLQGKTIDEAERMVEGLYAEFYKEPFVKLSFVNKRVVVLGDEINAVVPLENDNTNLLEVLALAGGVNFGSLGHNIRLIRGDLSNPEVFIIDLTTVEGMQASIVSVQPGDIIYVEPWRRPWLEVVRDLAPIIGLITSITTLAFLFATL